MTHTTLKTVARLTAAAAVLATAGCGGGGSDDAPNSALKVPQSTTTADDLKAGRGGLKKPAKR